MKKKYYVVRGVVEAVVENNEYISVLAKHLMLDELSLWRVRPI